MVGSPPKHHDRAGAVVERLHGTRRHCLRVQARTGSDIPTFFPGDTKIASQITAAQGNRKRGYEFQFIRDFNLGGEEPRLAPA